MGTTQSTPRQVKKEDREVTETVKMAASEDKILIDKILAKSRELYQKNKESFLDENFCKKIAITYSKKLYELPIQQVRNIYNSIEESQFNLEVSSVVDPLKEEKFLVNELSGRLVERFKNKKLEPTLYKGVKIIYPDVQYIQNRAIELLGDINKMELDKKQVGGRNYFNNNNEEEEEEEEEENYYNNEENENENENNEEEEENRRRGRRNNYENIDFSKMSYKERKKMKKKMWEEKKRREGFQKDNRRPDVRKPNITSEFKSVLGEIPKVEYKSETIKQVKAELNKILSNVSTQKNNSQVPASQTTPNAAKKNLSNAAKKNLSNVPKKNENKPTQPQANIKPVEERQNYRSVKNIESGDDKYCTDEKPCQLTKMEMCEKIIYHFIVRNNLIAAILSTVPFPAKDGEYKGSFVFERLKSLERGSFCLPPYTEIKFNDEKFPDEASKLAYENQRIGKILSYINNMDEKQCLANGGRVLILSKEQLQELYRHDALGRKYFDFAIKINNFYQNALIALYDILDNLQRNVKINTQNLNEISEQTKKIIDELYLKTQFNYLLAVLIILEFKFEKNTAENEIKNKRLSNIIREDFNV